MHLLIVLLSVLTPNVASATWPAIDLVGGYACASSGGCGLHGLAGLGFDHRVHRGLSATQATGVYLGSRLWIAPGVGAVPAFAALTLDTRWATQRATRVGAEAFAGGAVWGWGLSLGPALNPRTEPTSWGGLARVSYGLPGIINGSVYGAVLSVDEAPQALLGVGISGETQLVAQVAGAYVLGLALSIAALYLMRDWRSSP